MRSMLSVGLMAAISGAAVAGLENGDFEIINTAQQFGDVVGWEGGGGQADHGTFSAGNNGSLGVYFAFNNGATGEVTFQESSLTYSAFETYEFNVWAIGGGNLTGTVVIELGFLDGDDNFVAVASESYNLDGVDSWSQLGGVSYTVGGIGDAALLQNVAVAVYEGTGSSDIWFDNATLVPAPGAAAVAGLGGLALARRRR